MKRIVICSDGTWNTPDRKDGGVFAPSNVVRLARSVLPQDANGIPQVVFYDPGIGTDNLLDKLTGGAFGIGLSRNVRDAYLFLIHNYQEGDEIYFFGFSRGAYTVRSVAGMVRNVGLLKRLHADKLPEAEDIYRTRGVGPDAERAVAFRSAYSVFPVPIKFIGVWDTVGALGIPGSFNFLGRERFQFHNVALSSRVKYAFQALAIDEKRKFFEPTLWEQDANATDQIMEQVWFPGVHMDVGGGYRDASLASGALLWMAEKAAAADLALDEAYLKQTGAANPLGALHESRGFPYNLLKPYYRPIGQGVKAERSTRAGGSNEKLHASAEERYARDPSYRPPNLVEYLRGQGL